MTDTERLNLIEHYQWRIYFVADGWSGNGMFGILPHTYNTIREAIDAALAAQIKWSLG